LFNNDEGRGWGLGIGVKCQPLSYFLLAGAAVWGKILRLLWHLGRGPHAVIWTVLERLIFLEVQLVKLLISNRRHVV
jgi:hypothetical protein